MGTFALNCDSAASWVGCGKVFRTQPRQADFSIWGRNASPRPVTVLSGCNSQNRHFPTISRWLQSERVPHSTQDSANLGLSVEQGSPSTRKRAFSRLREEVFLHITQRNRFPVVRGVLTEVAHCGVPTAEYSPRLLTAEFPLRRAHHSRIRGLDSSAW